MNESAHLLVVDDDRRIRELLSRFLFSKGYRVTAAAQAKDARQALESFEFDLIILDVMMPGEDGISLVASLRASGLATPVLILSAKSDAPDRINGLAKGSDDYLGKPFEPEELLLRVQNLLRRRQVSKPSTAVRFGPWDFEIETGVLRREGVLVHLTGREKDIMRALAKVPGQPVSRESLCEAGFPDGARAIDVQVNRLRQKIEDDPSRPVHIQTMRGQGYCLYAVGI